MPHGRSLSGTFNSSGVSMEGCSKPEVSTVEEYIEAFDGTRAIRKLLLCNNGIAAVKCIRSIRKWSYHTFGNDRVIQFIVMVTPEDMAANAEFLRMADQHVDVPGGTNNYNYANVDLIVETAAKYEADAVWAGWGHASEYPKLPEGLAKIGVTFLGPPGHAMRSLGDKISSSIVAQSADVPTMPWSGSGLQIEVAAERKPGTPLEVPHDIYMQGCVTDLESAQAAADRIGYPVMIKASEGGGGKGIRKAVGPDVFPALFRQVLAEVPGSPVFIMKLASNARHLEVQVLADEYGNAISIFGRDCSVQRRHQKIIEEAPASIADPDVFHEMEAAAVRLSKMVSYVSAGTIEYLYSAETNEFHFLELNPRLQVEHPCSEMVSGVNLPAAQLQVAMGVPLHRNPDIRMMYGLDKYGTSKIDFDMPKPRPEPTGHVIACRITAENPDEGFKPSGGTVQELTFRSSVDVWGYFSVAADGGLHEYADSQFGHCFAWGATRDDARNNMVLALHDLSIKADFRTTGEYLVKLLEHEDFRNNAITTEWLDGLIQEKVKAEGPDPMISLPCAVVHIADTEIQKARQEYREGLERGQILSADTLGLERDLELVCDNIKYKVKATCTGANSYVLSMNSTHLVVDVNRMRDGSTLVRFDDNSYVVHVKEDVTHYRVVVSGKTVIFDKEKDASVCRTTATGKLLHYLVPDGSHVSAGDSIAEVEAMKMVGPFIVEATGILKQVMPAGTNFQSGDVLATLSLDDPTQVKRPTLFADGFPNPWDPTCLPTGKLHHRLEAVLSELRNKMRGYSLAEDCFCARLGLLVDELFNLCRDKQLPALQLKELVASLAGRLPQEVEDGLYQEVAIYEANFNSLMCKFPTTAIDAVIFDHLRMLKTAAEKDAFFAVCHDVFSLTKSYQEGERDHTRQLIRTLLMEYLTVEQAFEHSRSNDDAVSALANKYDQDYDMVINDVVAHAAVKRRNQVVIALLSSMVKSKVVTRDEGPISKLLENLAKFTSSANSRVALAARQILIQLHLPSFDRRRSNMEGIFKEAIEDGYSGTYDPRRLETLVHSDTAVFDVLCDFFYDSSESIVQAALEVYVRRAYVAYSLTSIDHRRTPSGAVVVKFTFHIPTRSALDPEGVDRAITMDSNSGESSRATSRGSLHGGSDVMETLSSPGPSAADSPMFTMPDSGSTTPRDAGGLMRSVISIDDMASLEKQLEKVAASQAVVLRQGVMATFSSLEEMAQQLTFVKNLFDSDTENLEPINVLNLALRLKDDAAARFDDDAALVEQLESFIGEHADDLFSLSVRRVTFVVTKPKSFPKYFTFRQRLAFKEDAIYRHVDPALAFKLGMFRLGNYTVRHCPSRNPQLHIYFATADNGEKRFFARTIMRHPDLVSSQVSQKTMTDAGDRLLLEALDELEVVYNDPQYSGTDCNHVFINFVPVVELDPEEYRRDLEKMVLRHGERLWHLRVLEAEIRMNVKLDKRSREMAVRFTVSNLSGYNLKINIYKEVIDYKTGNAYFRDYNSLDKGTWNGRSVQEPYPLKDRMQTKRYQAQKRNNTTYVYDYVDLFREAVHRRWRVYADANPSADVPSGNRAFNAVELVVDRKGKLVEDRRAPGSNDVGMVAWRLTMRTPEAPNGRQMIVIANDITFVSGSFSPKEDLVFKLASELARAEGLPRLYIAVNSGARIGLAKEIMSRFKVAWSSETEPWKGFRYLYLTPEDYAWAMEKNAVTATEITEGGEKRFKITAVLGTEDGLGVENLRGSGEIAGETSLSYEENFTMTLVTCRSVGIGAYLVRLGHRTIQNERSHIILTGHGAINKLLGKEVYSSSLQLGGPQIMYNNGVSHLTSIHDYDGVLQVLNWLSYVPIAKGQPGPTLRASIHFDSTVGFAQDPIDRVIGFIPTRAAYDPRWMLAGRTHNDNEHQTGFFDRGSFVEVMGGWARTVVTGRARLGGIPVGVIAVETNPVTVHVAADPANAASVATVTQQAGQVWYPDSAYKTAQAIRDMNGEDLPLFIFANWRGFSGGMRDMHDQVLKFGAMIVDNLRTFKQPVFVYLPPNCELRGGAWVVVDPTINANMMEMYADPESRGGVLEPEGLVSIKFRKPAKQATMYRLDDTYRSVSDQLKACANPHSAEAKELQRKLNERYDLLEGMYHQVAVNFADLHDRATRMKHKECIREVVPWAQARHYFYWRLRRRLAEERIHNAMSAYDPSCSREDAEFKLRRWFLDSVGASHFHTWDDDRVVAGWFKDNSNKDGTLDDKSVLAHNLRKEQAEGAISQIKRTAQGLQSEDALRAVMALVGQLDAETREALSRSLDSSA
eukprot:m.279161 g.279161  ORF g.279161 m.279161 type:complete len:2306 (+) comp17727_c0_seq1:161-7078(+)